jgi:hypothetical protein
VAAQPVGQKKIDPELSLMAGSNNSRRRKSREKIFSHELKARQGGCRVREGLFVLAQFSSHSTHFIRYNDRLLPRLCSFLRRDGELCYCLGQW